MATQVPVYDPHRQHRNPLVEGDHLPDGIRVVQAHDDIWTKTGLGKILIDDAFEQATFLVEDKRGGGQVLQAASARLVPGLPTRTNSKSQVHSTVKLGSRQGC